MAEGSTHDAGSYWEGSMSETSSAPAIPRGSYDSLAGFEMNEFLPHDMPALNPRPSLASEAFDLRPTSYHPYSTNGADTLNLIEFYDGANATTLSKAADIAHPPLPYSYAPCDTYPASSHYSSSDDQVEGFPSLHSEFEEYPTWTQLVHEPPQSLNSTHFSASPEDTTPQPYQPAPLHHPYDNLLPTPRDAGSAGGYQIVLGKNLNSTIKTPACCLAKPFQCDQCDSSFSRNHDLKRHARIHLAIKPFPCTWCAKAFSRKDALKRHLVVKGCSKNKEASIQGSANDSEKLKVLQTQSVLPPSLSQNDRSWASGTPVRGKSADDVGASPKSARPLGPSPKSNSGPTFTQIKLQNITCSVPGIVQEKCQIKRSFSEVQPLTKPLKASKPYARPHSRSQSSAYVH